MSSKGLSYKDAGVDIASGDEATARIKKLVRKTYTKAVLNGIGGFGGLYDGKFAGMKNPVPIRRSITCMNPAAVKTGSAKACRIAVMNIPQIVSGSRNIVIPGARIWMIVVM